MLILILIVLFVPLILVFLFAEPLKCFVCRTRGLLTTVRTFRKLPTRRVARWSPFPQIIASHMACSFWPLSEVLILRVTLITVTLPCKLVLVLLFAESPQTVVYRAWGHTSTMPAWNRDVGSPSAGSGWWSPLPYIVTAISRGFWALFEVLVIRITLAMVTPVPSDGPCPSRHPRV